MQSKILHLPQEVDAKENAIAIGPLLEFSMLLEANDGRKDVVVIDRGH